MVIRRFGLMLTASLVGTGFLSLVLPADLRGPGTLIGYVVGAAVSMGVCLATLPGLFRRLARLEREQHQNRCRRAGSAPDSGSDEPVPALRFDLRVQEDGYRAVIHCDQKLISATTAASAMRYAADTLEAEGKARTAPLN